MPSDESENFFLLDPLLTIDSTLFHGFSIKSRFCAIFFIFLTLLPFELET